ncbi:MAG: periplasmic heavy metal sensor [Prolixibacteraceae bacterium]|nr:periplasmic heavy metal sensor [Prolixibacteraceae bacterium]
MKTKILSILLVAALFVSTAAMAQSQPRNPQWEHNGQDRKAMMKKKQMIKKWQQANFLTDEQKEAAKKLRLETVKEVKPLKNELRELMAHQQTLTTADNADLKAINKNIDKIAGVKAEIAKIITKQKLAFRSMLTEDQLLKMESRKGKIYRNKRGAFMNNRMEHHGQPPFKRGA